MAMVVLVPGVLAFVFGCFAFRSRVTGVYLSIITQALTYALMLAFFRNDMGFGGNNGLTDFKDILGFDLHEPSTRRGLYVASVIALGWAISPAAYVTRSKLGRRAAGAARRREPRALPGLLGRSRQALHLHRLGGAGRHRRRALRAAGGHHQSQRVLARQFDRDRDLGGGRRPRHAARRRSSARWWSISPRPGSPARARVLAVSCWARSSSW